MRDTPEQWYETPEWRNHPCPNLRCRAQRGDLCIDARYSRVEPDGTIRIYWRFTKQTPHPERVALAEVE